MKVCTIFQIKIPEKKPLYNYRIIGWVRVRGPPPKVTPNLLYTKHHESYKSIITFLKLKIVEKNLLLFSEV